MTALWPNDSLTFTFYLICPYFSVVMWSSKWSDYVVKFFSYFTKMSCFRYFHNAQLKNCEALWKLSKFFFIMNWKNNILKNSVFFQIFLILKVNNCNLFWCKNNNFRFSPTHWQWLLFIETDFFLQKIISDKFISTMLNFHYYVSLVQ